MSNTNKIKIIFFSLFLVYFQNSFGQYQDFHSWSELTIEKKLTKKASLILQQDVRIQNNSTLFKDYITVIGASYKFNKHLKVRASYRFTYSYDIEDLFENEHRFYGDIRLKQKLQRFVFSYRFRYQLKYAHFNLNRWHHLRNRFSVKYNIPKSPFLPFAKYEFYYSLNNPVKNSIDRSKYTVGLEYGINKKLSVYTFYRLLIRREYFKIPTNRSILGIGIKVDI